MKLDLFAAWGFSKSPKLFLLYKKILSFYESVNIIVKSITKGLKSFYRGIFRYFSACNLFHMVLLLHC